MIFSWLKRAERGCLAAAVVAYESSTLAETAVAVAVLAELHSNIKPKLLNRGLVAQQMPIYTVQRHHISATSRRFICTVSANALSSTTGAE
eukprot:15122-Heterococcus_DN1.PRE.2